MLRRERVPGCVGVTVTVTAAPDFCGNGHGVGGEGQVDPPLPVQFGSRALCREEVHVPDRAWPPSVYVGGVGHVGQLYLEGPPVILSPELRLGTRVSAALPRRSGITGRGVVASTAFTSARRRGRVLAMWKAPGPPSWHLIIAGRAHEKVGDHPASVRRAHRREGRVGRNALAHEGGDARHLCREASAACCGRRHSLLRLRRCSHCHWAGAISASA